MMHSDLECSIIDLQKICVLLEFYHFRNDILDEMLSVDYM